MALPESGEAGEPVADAVTDTALQASGDVLVTNEQGLHLRPATEFARLAMASGCAIRVHHGTSTGDGSSILELAMMGIRPGARLRIEATGVGCEQAVADLVALVKRDFSD